MPPGPPNSMHRYGKVLLPGMEEEVHALLRALLPEGDSKRIAHVHAFYIKYGTAVGQTSLGVHRDDSHWTLNLCLSVSSDPPLTGSDLVFPASGMRYTHQAGRGIMHRGELAHQVEGLVGGERENLIVWVTLAAA
eukprot:GDKI01028400.1.p1 GENE.GDKI01028400.1~~GDKI01028400.1.p1  ORF type:complete len:135 (-),score=39.81 GDKI01028400.1:153-557(-)